MDTYLNAFAHAGSQAYVLFAICFLAGALHVASPDHWLPTALWSWRRGWTSRRTETFAALFLLNHLAFGLLFFMIFEAVIRLGFPNLPGDRAFGASVGVAFAIWGIRVFRFFRIGDEFYGRPNDLWNLAQILLFLGPAETVVPLLTRSVAQGWGWAVPFLAFAAGTLAAGVPGIVRARWSWNGLLAFPTRWSTARNPMQLLPAVVGILAVWLASGTA